MLMENINTPKSSHFQMVIKELSARRTIRLAKKSSLTSEIAGCVMNRLRTNAWNLLSNVSSINDGGRLSADAWSWLSSPVSVNGGWRLATYAWNLLSISSLSFVGLWPSAPVHIKHQSQHNYHYKKQTVVWKKQTVHKRTIVQNRLLCVFADTLRHSCVQVVKPSSSW